MDSYLTKLQGLVGTISLTLLGIPYNHISKFQLPPEDDLAKTLTFASTVEA